MAHLITPRSQAFTTYSFGGYTYSYSYCSYDYSAVDSCIYNGISTRYPSCIYYQDNACCTSWLSWEYSYFNCLQTAYQNCFDWLSYESSVSDFLPCYTSGYFTAPNQVSATPTYTVPALSLEPITTGPPTAPIPHSSIPSYSNTGSLLRGYCASPDYVLLDGPTAYWAPAVGCVGSKTDCCPYSITQTASVATITVVSTSTVTVSVDPNGVNSPYAGVQAYPTPASANLATLAHCPDDYQSVSGGCCPSGYKLWNAKIGGAIPCYSSLSSTLVPPAVPVTSSEPMAAPTTASGAAASSTTATTTDNQKPTSAIVNIVYAVQFPVQPSPGLSTGAKAGIGAGAGVAAIAIIVLAGLLIWRTRKQKSAEKKLSVMQNPPPETSSNNQSQTTAVSPYAYSARTELQTDGALQSQMQNPGGFVPTEQNGYFSPPQMQQVQPQYYEQQSMQQMPQMQQYAPQDQYGQQQMQQGTLLGSHGSPVVSNISPQPTGSDGYGHQTGYAGTIPSSTGSPPPQEGYGYQNQIGYAEVQGSHPPTVAGSPPPQEGYGYQNQTGYAEVQGSHPPTVAGSPPPSNYQGPYNPPGMEQHPQAQELYGQSPPGEMHG